MSIPAATPSNARDPKQCGAKTRGGYPCPTPPMNNGSGRCRMHGGASLRSIASPNFRDGSRSKYWPKGLRQRYEEARRDPELKLVSKELAITAARIDELLSSAGPDGTLTDAAWTQIYAFLELKAKLATAENQIVYRRRETYSAEEVAVMVQGLAGVVAAANLPGEVLVRVERQFEQIMGPVLAGVRPEEFPPAELDRMRDEGAEP